MKNTFTNTMQNYRKQSKLVLEDVSYLLGIDAYNLSRYENAKRKPSIDTILTYHILFDAELTKLFQEQYQFLTSELITRIKRLIQKLHKEQPPKFAQRIGKLGLVLNRLTTKDHE